jgi:hypothetical protein
MMRYVSSLALKMSLSGGSVRRVSREVKLAMVEECGVPVRLMTMGRISTSVPGQLLRMAFARGVYLAQTIELCERGCGPCSTSIPLSESF